MATTVAEQGIDLQVVQLPEAKRSFVLLPKRWVVERTFAWLSTCRLLWKGSVNAIAMPFAGDAPEAEG